jgi:hypothetical protein
MAYLLSIRRTIHLQTFKYTFTGQQAISFLQQQGMAGNLDVAADMCQRMLTQGLFKSSSHREVFLADGEVYRFSSSFPDGHKQKNRCSLPVNMEDREDACNACHAVRAMLSVASI